MAVEAFGTLHEQVQNKIHTEQTDDFERVRYSVAQSLCSVCFHSAQCVLHPSDRLQTCHWGVPHSPLQDVHHMKVKPRLHQLLFINTQPFNAAICPTEK